MSEPSSEPKLTPDQIIVLYEQQLNRTVVVHLIITLLGAALVGLQEYPRQPDLRLPAGQRLAFRELGLAIGLAAVGLMDETTAGVRGRFARYAALRAEIESFWLSPVHRQTRTWLDHEDINDVMLATSLAPEGFLVLDRGGATA